MPQWEGKSKATPLGYRIFVTLIKNFGVGSAYFLLRFVAGWYFLFSRKSSQAILSFYQKQLHFSKSKSLKMLYRNYYVFGQTLIDKMIVISGIKNNFTFEFDGEQNLHKIVEQGKGGILLSSHLGNWEAAGHLLKRLNTKINVVMYEAEHENVKQYLDSVTGEKSFNIITVKNDMSHIYKISHALTNNELVCIHADRFLEGNKTIAIKFFETDARFPEGPFLLASKFDVPVAFVFALKESNKHYHFFSSRPYSYFKIALPEILISFTKEIENKVLKYPEQWFNYYDFFKK